MINAQVLQGEAIRLAGGLGVNPQLMHDEACWLLENVGVRMNHPYLNKVLEDTGYAGFDGSSGRMHILRPLVDWALEQAPKRSAHPVPSKSFCGGGNRAACAGKRPPGGSRFVQACDADSQNR